MNKKNAKILLCIPPAYDDLCPPLGTPALTGFLRSKGVRAFQEDLNIRFFEYIKENKLEFMFTKKYKENKIKKRIYYHRDLEYTNRSGAEYTFEKVPGAAFDFAEKILSSKNLLRYIDDEEENIFNRFFKDEILASLKKEKFDMVGFSITAPSQAVSAFTFGRIIKSEIPKVKIVMGGQWVSFFREELMKRPEFGAFYDYAVYFEGETPLDALINSIKRGKPLSEVPNLIYKEKNRFILSKKNSEEDMNKLPCPDFDGLPLAKYSSSEEGQMCCFTFETSRGCYWNRCVFCVDLPRPKPEYREKGIELLVRDLKILKKKYRAKTLMISNTVFSPWQMKKFSKELIRQKINIEWWAMARFEKEFTREVLDLAKRAGCHMLGFGLESMNQRILDLCEKGTRTEIIEKIVKDIKEVKLPTYCQVIIGLPTETKKEASNTISFLLNYAGGTGFNNYYLIPKNHVFDNPKKYGIEFKKDPKLPFRFFYPFRHKTGEIDKSEAEKIIDSFHFASAKIERQIQAYQRAPVAEKAS